MNPEQILKEDLVTKNGLVLKRSILVPRTVNGLPYLVYPILRENIDTGLCMLAWPLN